MEKLRFFMPVGLILVIAAFGAVFMLLWNWLMPVIFGLVTVNFWQALVLLVLARLLFGGIGNGFWRRGRRHDMDENSVRKRWMQMTLEQRKEFVRKRRQFGFGHPFGRDYFDVEEQEQGKGDE
jgi:membrane protein implicated in regulation of membrane protease activity